MGYTIKDISEKTKLRPHVLRYYEKEGLLPAVNRTEGGIRHYSDDDIEWLGVICCLKNTGMSIRQIREFVELCTQGDHTIKQRLDLLTEHRQTVEEDIREMHRHLEKVTCKINYYAAEYEKYRKKQGEAVSSR